MPRATKAWSAGSNLRRLFGGRAALRRARGEARETSASGPSARRGGDENGGEILRASVGNGERVARPPTADEDTDYETASEGDAEAMAEAFLSVQDGEDDACDDDAWIRAGGSDRLEEVPSTSRRASFDASLPRASAFVAQEAPDASATHWSGDVEIMDWLKVRGPAYLRHRRKQTSAVPVMECVKVDLFAFDDAPCDDVADARPESWLNSQRRAWRGRSNDTNERDGLPLVPPHRRPWTFAFQFQNPGPPFHSIAAYFQPTGSRAGMCLDALLARERDTPFGRTLTRFLAADDATRDSKFKMVCALLDAPWALRTAVPRRPIILGKKLGSSGGLKYHRGDDYFAVDFELAQSPFMERVYRSLRWASACAEEEIVFMLEGQAEDELPECVLGAVRLKRVGESSFRKLPRMAPKAAKIKARAFHRRDFARDDPETQRRVSSPTGGGGG